MANFGQLYAWGLGHGVALASLSNMANEIGARNRRATGSKLYPVGIRSPLLDLFPVRRRVRAGYERGDGIVDTTLEMTLALNGYKYVLDTYLSSGAVVSVAMTFYLKRHELDTYARYNGYLTLPSPLRGDASYLRQNTFAVTFPVLNLDAL